MVCCHTRCRWCSSEPARRLGKWSYDQRAHATGDTYDHTRATTEGAGVDLPAHSDDASWMVTCTHGALPPAVLPICVPAGCRARASCRWRCSREKDSLV